MVSDDADLLAAALAREHGRLFAARYPARLRTFVAIPRPVRMWHLSRTLSADGAPITPGGDGPPTIKGAGSLLRPSTIQSFDRVILIVDSRRAAGATFDALGGYLAMAALAQLDADADHAGEPTVLKLFQAKAAGDPLPTDLSDWDRAYLRGLYATDANMSGRMQQRAIAADMAKSLRQAD